MKKYLIISFLFLLVATPTFAKNADNSNGQQTGQANTVTMTTTGAPTGNQTQNKNQVQTQNTGENQQLSVQTQESEQLNQNLDNNFQKVSDQVHQLIDTIGAKGGIGQQVKDIAQSQIKLQNDIKNNVSLLASRSAVAKFFVGSNKKTLKNMEQQMEKNHLMIQQLEELKIKTTNTGDLDQIEHTINLMTYQNTSLQEKIDQENKINGLFGWLITLFNR
jgi:hypothetical protein